MSEFSPNAESRAIAAASIKSAVIGSLLVAAFALFWFGTSSTGFPFVALILTLIIGFGGGMIFTGLLLLMVGLPAARLLRGKLESWWGLLTVFACATLSALCIGAIFGNAIGGLIVLPYALPAAYFYRCEILLEEGFK